jgi:hypothetical protein
MKSFVDAGFTTVLDTTAVLCVIMQIVASGAPMRLVVKGGRIVSDRR